MKTRKIFWELALSLLACQLAVSAPEYIANFSSFPAYPYNTSSYKQSGAFVGCGPTTGAMIFGYFQTVYSLTGLLTNPGTGVDKGLNTAWALHGSSYMNTQTDGFGDVYKIKSGIEGYAKSKGYTIKVVIHVSPTYTDPNNASWGAYGTYGDAWTNDGNFWKQNAGNTWSIDSDKFCDFLATPLSQGIPVFLTIDTKAAGSGDHWVPCVGYDKPAKKYAYYDTYNTSVHWADIYYSGDPAGKKTNSIVMVRTVAFIPTPPNPDIAVDSPSMNFGSVAIGSNSTKYLTISNTGTSDLSISSMDITGANASEFSVSGLGMFTLVPGNAKQVAVKFTPAGAGSKTASLNLHSNDPDENPLQIALSGSGGSEDPTQWIKTTGLASGTVNAFAFMGANVFAGTENGGVFQSTGSGSTWAAANSGLTYTVVKALAMSPATGGSDAHLFAGLWNDGIFRSTDKGANWTAVNTGLTNTFVTSLCADPASSKLLAGTWGGVFLTTDDGQHWNGINSGLTDVHVRSLLIHGTNFFAGTVNGLFRSTNNGSTWSAVNSGLTNTAVISLASIGSNLFAGTDGGGVFLSKNNGNTWTAVNTGLGFTFIPALTADSTSGGTKLYAGTWGAGVYRTTDHGASWKAFNEGMTDLYIRTLAIRPAGDGSDNAFLYAGSDEGNVWRRRLDSEQNGGLVVTHTGDSGAGSLREAINQANNHPGGDTIKFNVPKGVSEYDAAKGVWTIAPLTPLPAVTDGGLTIDGFSQAVFIGQDANPQGPEIQLDGSAAGPYTNGLDILSSGVQVYGLTINRFNLGIKMSAVEGGRISGCYIGTDYSGKEAAPNKYGIWVGKKSRDVFITPADSLTPNVISGNIYGGIFVADTSSHVSIIANTIGLDQKREKPVGNGNYGGICVQFMSDSVNIFDNWIGGNKYGIFILKSTHTVIQNNFIGVIPKGNILQKAGNESDGIFLSEGATDNLIEDNDILYNGYTGVRVNGSNSLRNKITRNRISGNANSGIMNDSGGNKNLSAPTITGASANVVSGTALPNARIEIYTDPGNQGLTYQGETVSGASGNFTWNGNLTGTYSNVTALAIDGEGNTSYFSKPVVVQLSGVSDETDVPLAFSLSQNFPNPFNPETAIRYTIPKTGRVKLTVCDLLGREVVVLKDGMEAAGTHTIRFDASRLSSGMYVYRIETADGILTKKLMLMK